MILYYKFLIPELEKLLRTEYNNELSLLADSFLFNEDDKKIKDKNRIFNIIVREYAYNDSLFNLCEEEFIVGKHLNLVDNKLWEYWESYIKVTFKYKEMINYWNLRLKVGSTCDPFVKFVENNYLKNSTRK